MGAPTLALFIVLAAPPTVADRIAHGHALLDSLDYDAAAFELTMAAQDPVATDDERLEANIYAGIAQRILGHDTEARLCFIYVLKHKPDAALPVDVAPKISMFFNQVKDELVAAPIAKPAPKPSTISNAPVAPVTTSFAWGPVVIIAGSAVAVVGVALGIAGSVPYLEHGAAHDGLVVAEAQGADGTALQSQQTQSRAAWDSWGALTATSGFVAAGVGVVVAGVGAVMWAGE